MLCELCGHDSLIWTFPTNVKGCTWGHLPQNGVTELEFLGCNNCVKHIDDTPIKYSENKQEMISQLKTKIIQSLMKNSNTH